jgi:hypothetical protein
MRVSTLVALGICAGGFPALAAPAAAQYQGEWELEYWSRNNRDRVHVQLYSGRPDRRQNGFSVDLEELVGLRAATLEDAGRTDVRFELRRDAGTIVFEGQVRRGEGWGEYGFTENPDFRAGMARLGHDDLTNREVFSMAVHGVDRAGVAALQDLGYDLRVNELLQFSIHGVTPDFIANMRDAGFGNLRASQLVQTRIHGLSADFIGEMAALGYANVPMSQLVQLRIHGVDPDFVRDVAELGYDDLPLRDLVQMRIHGVRASFLDDMRQLGFDLDIREAVQFRIHGVTTRFAEEMIEEYGDIDVDDLVQMKIHGERRWSRRRTRM